MSTSKHDDPQQPAAPDTSTPQRPTGSQERPARRRTDAISPGERRGALRTLADRVKARDDNPLESIGKAISSPVIEAANEEEQKKP